jgi:hypothetical protein
MRELGMAIRGAGLALVTALAMSATAQEAQDGASGPAAPEAGGSSENRVAVATDWSVFVETDPALECWGVSVPTGTRNTRDGEEVEVRRGDVLLFVANRPSASVAGEVSFTGGYPFAEESTVTMQIGPDRFEMFTRGEFAWPMSTEDDQLILAAMRRGREVVLTGRSARGTQTEDTFSLMGFSAAMEELEGNCSG